MLEMKTECESCQAKTEPIAVAYICSYECTFCKDCSATMSFICPNCNGDLVLRPTRQSNPSQ